MQYGQVRVKKRVGLDLGKKASSSDNSSNEHYWRSWRSIVEAHALHLARAGFACVVWRSVVEAHALHLARASFAWAERVVAVKALHVAISCRLLNCGDLDVDVIDLLLEIGEMKGQAT